MDRWFRLPDRALRLPLLAAGVAGCGGSIAGRWEGSCVLPSGDGEEVTVPFAMDLDEDQRRVTGEGTFEYDHEDFRGPVEGMRIEHRVEMALEGEQSGYSTRLEVFGDLHGDEIKGECAVYGTQGALEMRR